MTSFLPSGIDLTTLVSVGSFALFFVFVFFGQRIQYHNMLGSIRRSLVRLDAIKDQARKETIDYFIKTGKTTSEATDRIDQFLNYVTIMPVDLDPRGLVQKIGHLADTADERMRSEVKGMMKDADPVTVSVAQNLLEIASGLNMVDKVVRHYYLTARKTSSYMELAQLQMSLPQILQQASVVVKAIDSIELAQPIGDGVGPMVAARFLGDATSKQTIAKDTVLGVTEYDGRSLYVVKAEGPMGHVGQPGVAMRKIIEEMGVPISSIIMVDAAAKLEGEETGEVAEGVGAAIGGIGVEKFQIEELSFKHDLPVYAVLVKEGDLDVMATMKKEVTDGVQKAVGVVGRIIHEKTEVGDKVLLAGIGNTLGVGQ